MTSVGRGARTPPQVRVTTRQREATHVGGGVPDAPETARCRKHTGRDKSLPYNQPFPRSNPSPPIPGKTPGPGMPGPYRAAAGKPHAVRKRPRRGQDPSLRTDPSTGARAPGGHPRRGRRPRRPGNLLLPPIPGKTTGPGMPGPYRATAGKPHAIRKRPWRGQDPSLRTSRRRPSPGKPPGRACPAPTVRRSSNGDKKTEAIPFPGTASVLL